MNRGCEVSRSVRLAVVVFSAVLPCFLGACVMVLSGVSASIWLQNVVAVFLCSCVAAVCVRVPRKPDVYNGRKADVGLALCGILILATLFQGGIEGVHRWLGLGPVSLHIATIVVPAAIYLIALELAEGRNVVALSWAFMIGFVFLLQPDASQLTGFALAMMFCLFRGGIGAGIRLLATVLLIAMSVLAWLHLDSLDPVAHTEGIVLMSGQISSALQGVGLASVYAFPVSIAVVASGSDRLAAQSIVIYYWGITTCALFGNFPFPILGYGVSPIVGYFLAAILFLRRSDPGERVRAESPR